MQNLGLVIYHTPQTGIVSADAWQGLEAEHPKSLVAVKTGDEVIGPVMDDEVPDAGIDVVELLAAVDEGKREVEEIIDDDVVAAAALVAIRAEEMQLHTVFAEADA